MLEIFLHQQYNITDSINVTQRLSHLLRQINNHDSCSLYKVHSCNEEIIQNHFSTNQQCPMLYNMDLSTICQLSLVDWKGNPYLDLTHQQSRKRSRCSSSPWHKVNKQRVTFSVSYWVFEANFTNYSSMKINVESTGFVLSWAVRIQKSSFKIILTGVNHFRATTCSWTSSLLVNII